MDFNDGGGDEIVMDGPNVHMGSKCIQCKELGLVAVSIHNMTGLVEEAWSVQG